MALNEDQAEAFAQNLLLALANSQSIKPVGPTVGGGVGEEANTRRGRYDAVYLSTLYRELINELQK